MGAAAQAIDRSRGGMTTTVHAHTNVVDRPYALTPTPGHAADVVHRRGPRRFYEAVEYAMIGW